MAQQVDMIALECALTEATRMSSMFSEWLTQSVGFENAEPPVLTVDQSSNIYWAVTTVAHLIAEADRIFHERDEKGGER